MKKTMAEALRFQKDKMIKRDGKSHSAFIAGLIVAMVAIPMAMGFAMETN